MRAQLESKTDISIAVHCKCSTSSLLVTVWYVGLNRCLPLFFTGAKIHQSGGKLRCIEQGGVSYTLEEGVLDVPTGIASYLEHARLTLQKCKDVESAITNLEKQSSNESYFPVTIRRRPQKVSNSPLLLPEVSLISGAGSVSTVCQSSPSVLQQTQQLKVCTLNPTSNPPPPPPCYHRHLYCFSTDAPV